MAFAGAFALDNLQKYAEMLRQRKLLAEKTAFERGQVGVTNRRADEALNIQRQQLEGANEDRRLTRERQSRLDERQLALDAFLQGNTVAEQVQPGFLAQDDPVVKRLPPHLLTAQAARGGEDFAGPLQPGQTSPTARPGGFIKAATPGQRNAQEQAERALRDDERLEKDRIERERHNRELEARAASGGGSGNPYFSMQAIYDPQGRPIGAVRMDHRTGVATPVDIGALAGGQMKPPPGDLGKTSILNEASLDALDRLKAMYDTGAKSTIGPAMGRLRTAGQKIPGVPSDETFSNFAAATSSFRNAVIKAITGAQMSEPEANRIRQQIPEVTDKPTDWLAKYEQTKKNLADIENRIKADRGAGGSTSFRVVGERNK